MKRELTRIVELLCDLAKSLWTLLTTAVDKILNKIWRLVRADRHPIVGRLLLVLLWVVIVAVCARMGYDFWRDRHRRYYYYEKQLSREVETHYFRDDRTRVYNMTLGCYTTPRLEWVADAPERDTLTVFSRRGKRGFLNVNDGRIVIEARYDKAWVFSEGLAAVAQDNKIGFINARNEVVIPFVYNYSDRNGWEIDYVFRDGYCTMTDGRGACGLIDRTGRWVIEPQYDCIWTPHGGGYRIVKDGDKYGLLNPELQFAYPIEYDCIAFAADDAGVLLSQRGRKWQVDFEGRVTRPFVVDGTRWIYLPEEYDYGGEPMLSDYVEYGIESTVGVLRRDNGKIVIPAIYEAVNMLSETLFEVQLREGGNWILIDSDGNMVEN